MHLKERQTRGEAESPGAQRAEVERLSNHL